MKEVTQGKAVFTLEITISHEAAPAVEHFLISNKSMGSKEESAGKKVVKLTGYWFLPPKNILQKTNNFVKKLNIYGLNSTPGLVLLKTISLEDWSQSWKYYFKPIPIGRKILVSPSWITLPKNHRSCVIILDPGMAFGSGDHPTTKMCLEFLDEIVLPGYNILDFGTGSGILAIAAAKLGCNVYALDNDPLAILVAKENFKRNKVSKKIQLVHGSDLNLAASCFDLIVANLVTKTIIDFLPAMEKILKSKGFLIVSGIPKNKARKILSAFKKTFLTVLESRKEANWIAILAGKEMI